MKEPSGASQGLQGPSKEPSGPSWPFNGLFKGASLKAPSMAFFLGSLVPSKKVLSRTAAPKKGSINRPWALILIPSDSRALGAFGGTFRGLQGAFRGPERSLQGSHGLLMVFLRGPL